jgi:hypothetical protein
MRAWLALVASLAFVLFAGAEHSEAQSSWQCVYDFAQGLQGWVVRHGVYTGAQVRSEAPSDEEAGGLSINPSVDLWLPNLNTTITRTVVFFETVAPGILAFWSDIGLYDGGDIFAAAQNPPGLVTQEWSGSRNLNSGSMAIKIGVGILDLDIGSIRVSRIALEGVGDSPCSRPPVIGQNWFCSYNFAQGLQGWVIEKGRLENGQITSGDDGVNAQVSVWLSGISGTVTELAATYTAAVSVPWYYHAIDIHDGPEWRIQAEQLEPGQRTFRSVSFPVDHGGIRFTLRLMGIGAGYFSLSQIEMHGTGQNPCASNPGGPRTVYEIPLLSLYSALDQVNSALLTLPTNISAGVPDPDNRVLFGYAKFLLSPAIASEFGGPFAPIFQHVYVGFFLLFGLGFVYCVVWALVWILRFVVWIFRFILQLVDLVLQIAQVVGNSIGSLIKFIF